MDFDVGGGLTFAALLSLYYNREQFMVVLTRARDLLRKWDSLRSYISLKYTESSFWNDLKLADEVLQTLIDHWDTEIGPIVQFRHDYWDGVVRTFHLLEKYHLAINSALNIDKKMKMQYEIFISYGVCKKTFKKITNQTYTIAMRYLTKNFMYCQTKIFTHAF